MAYEALARKYRPRTFSEIVGQKPIVRTLTNALKAGRIHHAYVFSGVRGVGKTTIARIFAKALNCEKGPTPTPCLACPPCLEVAAGQDLDVIEMDAASRTGVDDVRDLIDTTRYAPARDRYKVFIVDEFHMLSRPAFNALLKTLEEPPPRVVFIMATTELHKVPGTVLSRTQQFDFRKVSVEEITDLLARIAGEEKVAAPRACLEILARAGDGSVRDAESLLDQAIATCGPELDEDSLRALLGLVPDELIEQFFGAAADRDAARLLTLIASIVGEGHDLRVFLAGLIDGARRLLLLRSIDDPSEILGLEKTHQARLRTIADRFETVGLLRILSVLMGLEGPLKYSEQPRYVLEAAAIRLATIADLTPIEELIARFGDGPGTNPQGPAPGKGAARIGSPAGASSSSPAIAPPPAVPPPRPGRKPERSAADVSAADLSSNRRPAQSPEGAGRRGSSAVESSSAKVAPETETVGRLADASAESTATGGLSARHDRRESRAADSLPGGDGDETDMSASDLFERDEPPPLGDDDAPGATGDELDLPGGEPARPGVGHRSAQQLPGERGPEAERLLVFLNERKMSLAVLVDQAEAIVVEANRIVLGFDASKAFARKSLESASNLASLSQLAAEALGRPVAIQIARAGSAELPAQRGGSASTSASRARDDSGATSARSAVDPEPDLEPDAAAADGDAGSTALLQNGAGRASGEPALASGSGAAPMTEARRRRLISEAEEDPLVKKLLERFDGRIVEVKEAQ